MNPDSLTTHGAPARFSRHGGARRPILRSAFTASFAFLISFGVPSTLPADAFLRLQTPGGLDENDQPKPSPVYEWSLTDEEMASLPAYAGPDADPPVSMADAIRRAAAECRKTNPDATITLGEVTFQRSRLAGIRKELADKYFYVILFDLSTWPGATFPVVVLPNGEVLPAKVTEAPRGESGRPTRKRVVTPPRD